MSNFVGIGFGNYVNATKIVTILALPGAAANRIVAAAKERDTVIDGTAGRKTRAVIVLEDGYVLLSGVNAATLKQRLNGEAEDE